MMYMSDDTLNALTVVNPTTDEYLLRAKFWRKFAASIDVVDDKSNATYNLIVANCSDMDARAYAMAAGISEAKASTAPVVTVKPARKVSSLTAEQFWTLQAAAVSAIRAEHGDRWYLIGETVTGSLPSKLRSMIGPLGGKITWRRDHRFPAARYWPDGAIPTEVSLAPVWVPSADFYAPERDLMRITREAQQEQIVADRALTLDKRIDAALAGYWRQIARLDDAIDGMVRHTIIKSVNSAADNVIALFDDSADTIEQESRDDMDAERDAQILADEFDEQETVERAARLEAERFTAECEAAELDRAARAAEYEDYRAAEQREWNRLEREARDADRVMLAQRAYVVWWADRLAQEEAGEVQAAETLARMAEDRREAAAELARLARERLAAELEAQEVARKAAEHAERKVAWESAQARKEAERAEIERIRNAADIGRGVNAAIAIGAARVKRPAVSSAFNAGRAAFLASLQDAAD